MDCCGCDGYPSPFDGEDARRDREAYAADGPDETTRLLLDMIEPGEITGASVLDVGGGVGVIDHELLRAGASRAVLVEASPAYAEGAREAAEEAGLLERLEIVAADFVRHAHEIDEADVVTLDRVVCCYRGGHQLVETSAAHARKLYGLVLPRDRWYVRPLTGLDNLRWRLRGATFRLHAHSNSNIDRQLGSAGWTVRSEALTRWWRVVLYARRSPA